MPKHIKVWVSFELFGVLGIYNFVADHKFLHIFFPFFSGGTSSLKKMDNYAEIGAPEISGISSILSVAERNRNNFPNQSQERLLKWTKVTNKPVPCGRKLSHIKFIYSEKATKIWRNLQTFFDATKYFQIKLGVFVKF